MAGLQLSERESSYYQQLFALADTDGQGAIGGLQAFNFLTQSGVDRGVLKQIWDIADYNQTGAIGADGFSAAMRLIAHAQAGAAVSPDQVQIEPQTLAFFQGVAMP